MSSNTRKRKRPSLDNSSSDSDSGDSTNAISPHAATVQPPMFSTSPPREDNNMTSPNDQPPSNISSLSEDEELIEAINKMNVSSNKPPLKRSSTRGGKTKKRKTMKKNKRKWSKKYKKSINCKKPKGFSQKQYCKYGRKKRKTKKSKK